MPRKVSAPIVSHLEIPADAWTQPFWDRTATGELCIPACEDCQHFRWPPGPFCPNCRSQRLVWRPAGPGTIYSFTLIDGPPSPNCGAPTVHAPALIEFLQAGGVRLLAAIIDSDIGDLCIGASVELAWSPTANCSMPVFKIPA